MFPNHDKKKRLARAIKIGQSWERIVKEIACHGNYFFLSLASWGVVIIRHILQNNFGAFV